MNAATVAKVSVPRLFGAVVRDRLFSQLAQNRGRPLIWIDGPPGAGKTTLAASYLEHTGQPVLWYQVDKNDADPGAVFHYLGVAAQTMDGTRGVTLPGFLPEHSADVTTFASAFFRQLFRKLPSGAVLVFDNMQDAAAATALYEMVYVAAHEIPVGGSIVCVSRSPPPPSLSPLIASGMFFSMHWETLKFTLEETRSMCANRGVTNDNAVRQIFASSEGWAAGVTLMLEGVSRQNASEAVELPPNREEVFDYFAMLLFDRTTQENRDTLRLIAYLPYVTVAAAQRLSGNADVHLLLEDLHKRHLFTERRPAAEPTYQFHALFRNFLRARAEGELVPEVLRRLKLATADELRTTGHLDDAIALWRDTQSWDEVVACIVASAPGLLRSGRWQTVLAWIDALPPAIGGRYPWVAYWCGMAQLQTAPERGIDTLREALAMMKQVRDTQGVLMCVTGLLNAGFLAYHAVEWFDGWLDDLLGELPDRPSFPSVDLELRFWGALCSGLFWTRPSHPWTLQAAQHVETLLAKGTDPNIALAAASGALNTSALTGDFPSGERIVAATEHLTRGDEVSPAEVAWWLNRVSYLRFVQARYEDALALLDSAMHLCETHGMGTMLATTIYHRFMVQFRVSGTATADATLARIEAMPKPANPVMEAMFHVYRARQAQYKGRREAAADLAEVTHAVIQRTRSPYQELLFGFANGDLLLDAGRTPSARQMISRCAELIEQAAVFESFRPTLALIESRVAQVEGRIQEAKDKLGAALDLARKGNGRYFFRWLDASMPELFVLALTSGIQTEFVQELIHTFRLRTPANAPSTWPRRACIYTLGRFVVIVDGEPIQFSRKVPKKTLALLKSLVAHGSAGATDQSLCDALWFDEEADAARQALSITVVRLRKLLGSSDCVIQQGGKISLDRGACWVDAWEFEEGCARLADRDDIGAVLAWYSGVFLPDDTGESWSVTARERLRGRFIHLLATHGTRLEAAGRQAEAIELYMRGIDADPVVEAFYQGLMRCYAALGRHTEAASAFRRMRQTLSVVLGIAPSQASRDLFADIRAHCDSAFEEDVASVVPLRTGRRGVR